MWFTDWITYYQSVSNVISTIAFLCKQRATMIVKARYNKTKRVRGFVLFLEDGVRGKKEALSHSHQTQHILWLCNGTLCWSCCLSEEKLACVPLLWWISSYMAAQQWCNVEVLESTGRALLIFFLLNVVSHLQPKLLSWKNVVGCHVLFSQKQVIRRLIVRYIVTRESSVYDPGVYFYLLALVESSLEVLLMLALLSRFFLQSVSLCLVWLEEGGDEEELVLARESSSDIPVWIGEEPGPEAHKTTTK